MSLLRQRAMAVSFESTLRERSPRAARAWFVRLMSFASDAELRAFASQASVARGAARSPAADSRNATAVSAAMRREARAPRAAARFGSASAGGLTGGCDNAGDLSWAPAGEPVSGDRRPAGWCPPGR